MFKGFAAGAAVSVVLALGGTGAADASSCKRATVRGASKCLKSGQFCSRGAQSDYRRAGFKCVRGSDGRYRLRRA